MADHVCTRLRAGRLSGRTVSVKLRRPDFATLSRSVTLPGPTDDVRAVAPVVRRLLAEIDTSAGIRLLGVGVSGLVEWAQEELFDVGDGEDGTATARRGGGGVAVGGASPGRWAPGQDVRHTAYGPGWVWGAGRGRVTVRFETRETGPGPVRTFRADDPDLVVVTEPR
jgi:DNA polymerase-4